MTTGSCIGLLPITSWDFGRRGLLAERGRGGKLLNGSRDDSFLPTVEPPGEEGEDWLELWPESEFAACWQVLSVFFNLFYSSHLLDFMVGSGGGAECETRILAWNPLSRLGGRRLGTSAGL